MKLFHQILQVILLSMIFIDCSIFYSNSSNDEYMPLSVGNKWMYNEYPVIENDNFNRTFIKEIVDIDTIEGKEYFRVKRWYVQIDSISHEYSYYQRVSNDTLYNLDYNKNSKQYIEWVDAIFSLELNEEATIYLKKNNVEFEEEKPEIERLPTIDHYKIKVINKNENTVEFLMGFGNSERNYTTTYKKGIGLFHSSGSKIKLKKYIINH